MIGPVLNNVMAFVYNGSHDAMTDLFSEESKLRLKDAIKVFKDFIGIH